MFELQATDFSKHSFDLRGIQRLYNVINVPKGVDTDSIFNVLKQTEEFLDATRIGQSSLTPGLEQAYIEVLNNIASGLDKITEQKEKLPENSSAGKFLKEFENFMYACVQNNLMNQPKGNYCTEWFDSLDNLLRPKLEVYYQARAGK